MGWSLRRIGLPLRRSARCAFAAGLGFGLLAVAQPAVADVILTATYNIAIGGITIGRAEVRGRFTENSYTAAIDGSTWGFSRFVSDARASLSGVGRISGTTVSPASYDLDTSEAGFDTRVRMAMRGGSVTDVEAYPSLVEAADRVPLTSGHKRGVLDPVGAFLVALDQPADGRRVCNRTVKVFDGWQRYDIRLQYADTRTISSGYNGEAIVCAARYVPVAGHRPSRESVEYMANNKRLEVWMVPVAGTNILLPYRFLIGTEAGDLIVMARQFQVTAQQASAQ